MDPQSPNELVPSADSPGIQSVERPMRTNKFKKTMETTEVKGLAEVEI